MKIKIYNLEYDDYPAYYKFIINQVWFFPLKDPDNI